MRKVLKTKKGKDDFVDNKIIQIYRSFPIVEEIRSCMCFSGGEECTRDAIFIFDRHSHGRWEVLFYPYHSEEELENLGRYNLLKEARKAAMHKLKSCTPWSKVKCPSSPKPA